MAGRLFEPTDLPELAPPDPIAHAIFEAPVLPAVALAVLAVLAFVSLRAAGRPTTALVAGAAGVAAAGAVLVTASLVTTDREHVDRAARTLVDATATADEPAMRRLLADDARAVTRFASAEGRDRIVELASTRAAPRIKEHSIKGVEIELLGPRVARSHVRVRTEGLSAPSRSVWEIDWTRDDPDSPEWYATRITPLWIRGVSNPSGD